MAMLDALLRALRQRIANLAARGVVLLVADGNAVQQLQVRVLAGELRDRVQRVQPYGFNSVPLGGAYPVVLLCPGGDRAQALAVAVDDVRHRPTGGEPGESGLYDSHGNRVRLRNGVLEITAAADLQVAVAGAGNVTITGAGNLTVQGGLTVTVTGNATVNATGAVTITTAGALNLGGAGGPGVARIGDAVNLVSGLIVGGSTKVKAV